MGQRDRRALTDNVARINEHLLKLQHSPAEAPRPGWETSIDVHRSKVRKILVDSPGLRADLPSTLDESYADGRRFAARALRGEVDPKAPPQVCPYTLDRSSTPTGGRECPPGAERARQTHAALCLPMVRNLCRRW